MMACSSDDNTPCEKVADNPLEEYAWLKEIQNNLSNCACERSIIQGTYQGQTVFYVTITDQLCSSMVIPTLYNCKGEVVRQYNDKDFMNVHDEVKNIKVLYRCNEY